MMGLFLAMIFRISEVEVHPQYAESYLPYAVEVASVSATGIIFGGALMAMTNKDGARVRVARGAF